MENSNSSSNGPTAFKSLGTLFILSPNKDMLETTVVLIYLGSNWCLFAGATPPVSAPIGFHVISKTQ